LPESKTYQEKLLDPRWQKKRLEIFERDQWTCQTCLATDKTLHIHHRSYSPGLEPWDYEDFELLTLCADCHHSQKLQQEKSLADLQSSIRACGLSWKEISWLEEIIWSCLQLKDYDLIYKLTQILDEKIKAKESV
jgi:hypothetical protein